MIVIFFSVISEIIASSSGWSHMCRLCLSMLGQVEVPGMLPNNLALFKVSRNALQL